MLYNMSSNPLCHRFLTVELGSDIASLEYFRGPQRQYLNFRGPSSEQKRFRTESLVMPSLSKVVNLLCYFFQSLAETIPICQVKLITIPAKVVIKCRVNTMHERWQYVNIFRRLLANYTTKTYKMVDMVYPIDVIPLLPSSCFESYGYITVFTESFIPPPPRIVTSYINEH